MPDDVYKQLPDEDEFEPEVVHIRTKEELLQHFGQPRPNDITDMVEALLKRDQADIVRVDSEGQTDR